MASQPSLPNGLPAIQRHITTHNSEGKAVLSTTLPSEPIWQPIGDAVNFFLAYTTHTFPVSLKESEPGAVPHDIQNYEKDLKNPPGLSINNGTVCRFVDFAPGSQPYMHRTESLDYGVVLEGTIELSLDSGETRIMNRGDVCVQRATMHAWKSITENDGWARMMFVLVSSEKVVVGGKETGEELGEELGDMSADVPRNSKI